MSAFSERDAALARVMPKAEEACAKGGYEQGKDGVYRKEGGE
jgi:hypothetical protein